MALVGGGNTPTITNLIGPNQGESEMKTHLLSLLAGTALIATVSVAQASEPTALSESQMDQVTAGVTNYTLVATTATNLRFTASGLFDINMGPGVKKNISVSFTVP